jgi:hypothetical protein
VLGVALAEIGVRVLEPIPTGDLLPRTYDRESLRRIVRGDSYLRFDQTLGWGPRPSTSRGDDKVVYRANSAGFRAEREYSLDPAPGTWRIAAFGDSFTHCDESDYRDCWTAQLEQRLPRSEVLNFGVPGYGPDQAWLRYQRDGRQYQPCAVLIGYLVENIHRVVNRFRPFYAPEDGITLIKPRFLLGEGEDELVLLPNPATAPEQLDDPRWVEATLGSHDHWYFPGTFAASPFDLLQTARLTRTALYREARRQDLRSEEGLPYVRAYETRGEAYQVAGRVLINFARDVRASGATPVVVIFPGRRDLEEIEAEDGEKLYQPLVDWLAVEGIPTVDLADPLLRVADDDDMNELFIGGGHYEGPGNEAVAAALARRLPEVIAPTCP